MYIQDKRCFPTQALPQVCLFDELSEVRDVPSVISNVFLSLKWEEILVLTDLCYMG